MVVQTLSIKNRSGGYLFCRDDGRLSFDTTVIDPSCKFHMVPWGAGRTCLKGPNGKFINIHGNRFLCDGIYTGVGFIFIKTSLQLDSSKHLGNEIDSSNISAETTLQLDSGKYLSDVTDVPSRPNTITASDTPTYLEMKPISFESFDVNMSLSVPAIIYNSDVSIEDSHRPGRNYLVLKNYNGTVDIIFSIPYTMDREKDGTVELIINHCRDLTGGNIDINLNDKPLLPNYSQTPTDRFEIQNLGSLVLAPLLGENKLSIKLSQGYLGNYYFSDAALVFKDRGGYVKQENSVYALGLSSGSSYSGGTLEDRLRKGNPYLSIEGETSWSKTTFTVRREMLGTGTGFLTIEQRRESGTSIDIFLNGKNIEEDYNRIPTDSFGPSNFFIPSDKLQTSNELVIKPKNGRYYISNINIYLVSPLPDVNKDNFDNFIKEWILYNRNNIGELNKIPRNDFSAWKFVREAPYWFFLPFLSCSPEELGVLFRYHNMRFLSVAYEIKDMNHEARLFHSELLSTDLARKNAQRHAYWTALLSRRFGMYFALDFSTAHEVAHVDLTIEGPFDHVTDKINNAVGSLLGSRTPWSDDALKVAVDAAWKDGELAYAKNFRQFSGGQTADIYWQTPLDMLAKKYIVTPRFSQTEQDTLKKMGVDIPNVPIIH